MKMKRILSAVLSAAVLATGVPAIVGTLQAGAANPAANLLTNGDFSQDTGFSQDGVENRLNGFASLNSDFEANKETLLNWTRYTVGNATIYNAIVTDPDDADNRYMEMAQTLVQGVEELANGKTFQLSFRAKTLYDPARDTTFEVGILPLTGDPVLNNVMTNETATSSAGDVWTDEVAGGIRVTIGQSWTTVTMQFTLQDLEDGKPYFIKFLDNNSTSGQRMAIDDMVLTEVGGEEPTEPTVAITNGDFETATGFAQDGITNRIPGWAGLEADMAANHAKLTNWLRVTGGNAEQHAKILEENGNHYAATAQTLLQGIDNLTDGTYRLTFKMKALWDLAEAKAAGQPDPRLSLILIEMSNANGNPPVMVDATVTTDAVGETIFTGNKTVQMPVEQDWKTYTVEFELKGLEDGKLYGIKFIEDTYQSLSGPYQPYHFTAFDDVSIEKVEVAEKADVALETGKDDGTIKDNGDGSFTATPYPGNSFDGWYNGDTKVSGDATATLAPGATYVAKFVSNNLIESPGYELYGNNQSLKDAEGWVCGASWGTMMASSAQHYSGAMSAAFMTRFNATYRKITGLKKNTDYTVSYKWLLPAVYDSTSKAGMRGMIVTDTDVKVLEGVESFNVWNKILSDKQLLNEEGYYTDANLIQSTGEWATQEFTFNTGDNTEVMLYMQYDCETKNANGAIPDASMRLYLDEFTIYEKGVVVEKKTVGVSADENGTAYIAKTDYEVGEKATVTAKPNINYVFEGWYDGSTKVSDQQTYTFTVEKSIDLVAKFVRGPIKYDVSQDGRFDETDIEQVQSYLIGAASLSESSLEIADVTGEGKVTVSDVVKLKRLLEEKENGMTKEQTKEALLAGTYDKFLDASVANKGNQARLANVLKKAQAGEKITIGFIGGSITEGAGVTAEQDRYVNQVFDWWTTNFPQATFELVNAGIGATSSLVGVSRVETDLLSKDPDFVVVDFTTNDDGTNNQFRETYENLVRRILEHDTEPAVMMIMFGAVDNAQYQQGKYVRKPNSAANHMATGLFYDVPVIDYNEALWQYLGDEIEWTDVAADYIHPNAAGHRMAAACIKSYLDAALTKLDVLDTKVPALPTDYFYGDRYMKAEMVVPTAVENVNEGFTKAKVLQWENAWVSGAEGGKMTFTIENAKAVTFLYRMDGAAKITVNDKVIDIADVNNPNVAWPTETIFFDNATTLQVSVEAPADFALVRVLVNK